MVINVMILAILNDLTLNIIEPMSILNEIVGIASNQYLFTNLCSRLRYMVSRGTVFGKLSKYTYI